MVDALERHPSVRVALHYSGPLLDWMRAERPEFIGRLRVLADRGQVEIMGGGYAEPILVSLPERDRVGQLRRMADEVEERVRGAAERRVAGRAGLGAGPARRRSSPGARPGRSSTTRTSGRRPSRRTTCGVRTSPRTRAARSRSSGPSRGCATGSRGGPSRTSSSTCARTRPRTGRASG